ncbi:hypothetical protein VTO42DRAFT_6716 [Malbranchea cinnamomea]
MLDEPANIICSKIGRLASRKEGNKNRTHSRVMSSTSALRPPQFTPARPVKPVEVPAPIHHGRAGHEAVRNLARHSMLCA